MSNIKTEIMKTFHFRITPKKTVRLYLTVSTLKSSKTALLQSSVITEAVKARLQKISTAFCARLEARSTRAE